MRTRKLGRTELQISEIGFGALEIGRPWGLPIAGDFVVPEEREVHALLDRALELGINLIDTAPAYMQSEERLGKLLKNRRKEFYLASKCGEHFDGTQSRYDFSAKGTLEFIETSLRRLHTDYLDLIQIHCGPDEVETVRGGETLQGMLRAKAAGKVRWIGVSCHESGALAALESGAYDVLQLPYSILNRTIAEPWPEGGDSILSLAAQNNIGILIRESLEHGKLTDKIRRKPAKDDPVAARLGETLARLESRGIRTPLSQLAIQYVLRRPEVSSVLVGTRNARHLEQAIEAAARPLGARALEEIEAMGA